MEPGLKLKIYFSLIIILLGLGSIWFGSTSIEPPFASENPSPSPSVDIVISLPQATQSAQLGVEGEKVLVTRVVDGDTVILANGATVRLIGIDTPETKDPRKPVQCFGKEASNETKKLVEGKTVILEKDVSNTDKYQRLLRYIYLPLENGQLLFVNDYLIREGFAYSLTYPPDVKYNERLLEAQTEAKNNKKGLWGRC